MLNVRGQQHSFLTQGRIFLQKRQSFWDRKCLDLRGARTPNLRILAKCFIHLSCQGQTFAILCFWLLALAVEIFYSKVNTLRPRQNDRYFPDDILFWIFLNENVWISINISLRFVPKGPINNIPALVQIMAWCRPGDKPLSEPMMVSVLTHMCVTRPQWVNIWNVNCLRATAFIFNTLTDVLVKVKVFETENVSTWGGLGHTNFGEHRIENWLTG